MTNQYDGFGRLVLHRINLSAQQRTLTYQYDRNGNRTRIAHPDGVYFTYEYDGLDRPLYYRTNGTTLSAYQGYYQHGGLGDRILTNGASVLWGYDGLQRRSGLTLGAAGTAADAVWTWSHNPAGQVAAITRDNDAYAFVPSNANVGYTADGLNRYTAAGGATFTYDANGNLTNDGSRTYLYDVENRLVGASGGITLVYDPLGRLYEVIGPSSTTRFLYDGDAPVAEYNSTGGMIARYMHDVTGTDVPMLSYPSSALTQPSWLHADRLGSIVLVTDAAGAGTINAYDEYGVPAATNVGRFQYTGQIWIPEIGMYHYKARVYSPHLGRFMQTDPVGYDDQFNLYAYVGNDPINMADSSGRCGSRIDDVISASCSGGTVLGLIGDWREKTQPQGPRAYGQGGGRSSWRVPSVEALYARKAAEGDPYAALALQFGQERPTNVAVAIARGDLLDALLVKHGAEVAVSRAGAAISATPQQRAAAMNEYRQIRLELANAYVRALRADTTGAIGRLNPGQIYDFHREVFSQRGISMRLFGGSTITGSRLEAILSATIWCPRCIGQ